jgi:Photosynthetic reaction centre cytochrome C subunit
VKRLLLPSIPIFVVVAWACTTGPARPAPAPSPAGSSTPPLVARPAAADSAAVRDRFAKEVLATIAGQEGQPASQVFKNVKLLTTVPAGRLVAIMNQGYGRSLGVSCAHCHVTTDWASDDKPEKQIARDMIQMAGTINTQLLANIKNLKGPQPIVNCTTCHRGQVKPALNLPP